MSSFGPDGGTVTFESDVLRCKSPEIPFDASMLTLINIYKQYFRNNVDKVLVIGIPIV